VAEVYRQLETSAEGLLPEEVGLRQRVYGPNRLAQPARPSWRTKALSHLGHPYALVLWLAGALAFFVREPVLGGVIWSLVVVSAAFSFWREYRAEKAMQALERWLPAYARLVRAGSELKVPADQLVPGDVLLLAEGDSIPADARVVEEYGLRVNNAVLTGEAVPARKTADASLHSGLSELERPNLLFAGTQVVGGTGRAVIYATGMQTQFGRVAHLTQQVQEGPSWLQRDLARSTRIIGLVALGLALLVFVVGILDVHLPRFEAFILALGILVAAIPEGLPATVTLSLAMAGLRLAQKGVLVKKLSVLETLATVSVICTDKNGTLTQNQMTVRRLWLPGLQLAVSGVGYEPKGGFLPDPIGSPIEADVQSLLTAALLCNNSRLIPPSSGQPQWTSLGDQTEVALRVVALKGGLDEEQVSAEWPRLHELPFDARRKRMSTVHFTRNGHGSGRVVFVKGAPREVLQLCTHYQVRGQVCPLDEATRSAILAANDDYARGALRVLALARRKLNGRGERAGRGGYAIEDIERELTFLGLVAMMDPPRPQVDQAIQACRQAGIRMVMITGDYGLTAESLARRVGLLTTQNPRIITGADLETLDDAQLNEALNNEVLFARMAPEHKLRLVALMQARGEVVAVTGDGVNDAPALRKADVGIAMGLTGTDVAKEASDLILTDDNFAAIAVAIEEGRAVFDNLRKFITYIFSSNVPEVLPFILTALTNLPLALLVKQILAIDLGTDLFPALALGMEKPEPDVMTRPPRPRSQPLIDSRLLWRSFLWLGLIEAGLCYSGFFLVYALNTSLPPWLSPELAGILGLPLRIADPHQLYILAVTVFHAGVVMAQVGNAFACRSYRHRGRSIGWISNPYLLGGVLIEMLLILALIYIPPLARLFDHQPIPLVFWGYLALYPPLIYSLDWIRKAIVRKIGP
jgi:Ca2+-transporting ATPase